MTGPASVNDGRWDGQSSAPYSDRVAPPNPTVRYARPHGLRRMIGRDPHERHRTATRSSCCST